MLIINADDFGQNRLATERILSCCKRGVITSTSAMVFMEDSRRAADLAKEHKLDVGLHLNFSQEFTQQNCNSLLFGYHNRIVSFLSMKKYNFLIFNPLLHMQFDYIFRAQLEEFENLYGVSPSHIDGHHHMHLCTNMLIRDIIPAGQKVRRNFSYSQGEKTLLNRMYRSVIDLWLSRKHITTDFLFSLSECIKFGRLERAFELAKTSNVELETHPEISEEFECLMGSAFVQATSGLQKVAYSQL